MRMIHPKQQRRAKEDNRGFTLVELLAVIAIMAVVTMMAVNTFNQFGKGSGMKAAVHELKTTLSLARQWAITHRQRVYVVFPDADLNFSGIEAQMHKVYRAYGVYAVSNRTTGAGEYIRDWSYLPQGIVFDADDSYDQQIFDVSRLVTNVYFPDSANRRDMFAIVYKPDGSTVKGSGYEVYLSEGWCIVNTNDWTLDYGVNTKGMRRGVEVTGLTGGTKVIDYGADHEN